MSKISPHLPAAVWTAFLLLMLLMPGDSIPSTSGSLSLPLPDDADKGGHALLFFFETIFLTRSLRHIFLNPRALRPLLMAALAALSLAFTTEILQTWIPLRRRDSADLAANIIGIGVAVICQVLLQRLWKRANTT